MRPTTKRFAAIFSGTLLAMVLGGCGEMDSGSETSADGEQAAAKARAECMAIVPVARRTSHPRLISPWVDSADGDLSLMIEIIPPVNPDTKTATVIAVLRNNSDRPIAVLKPLADWCEAETVGLELTASGDRCRFTGPIPGYLLGKDAFAIVEPGEMAGHSLTMDLANYEGSQENEEYRLIYRYAATPSHGETAKRFGFEDLWTGEMTSAAVVWDRGEDRPENEFEKNVSIVFAEDEYVFTLDEVAKGISFDYQIDVGRDFEEVVVFVQHTGGGMGVGPDGPIAYEEIVGNGQSYALQDVGLGFPVYDSAKLAKGSYARSFEWDGRNWGGPSDYEAAKGPPFPTGTYALYVSIIGNVGTPQGRRFFHVDECVPVILKP